MLATKCTEFVPNAIMIANEKQVLSHKWSNITIGQWQIVDTLTCPYFIGIDHEIVIQRTGNRIDAPGGDIIDVHRFIQILIDFNTFSLTCIGFQ